MIISFYVLFLAAAAGIVGLFIQDLLYPLGYTPDLHASLALTAGAALLYFFIQLLFMSLLKLFRPGKGILPYISECCSHLGAAILLLPLLDISIPLPHPALEKVEPFVYLGGFLLWHGFFKLFTLFSETQSKEGSMASFLGWGIACGLSLLAALGALGYWQDALLNARMAALEAAQTFKLGDAYVRAQSIYEGAIVSMDLPEETADKLLFRWSRHPDLPEEVTNAYVTLEFDTTPPELRQEVIPLDSEYWYDLEFEADEIPDGATMCSIQWYTHEEPAWMAQTGLRPPEPSSAQILVTGPHPLQPRRTDPAPNVLLIALDGLGLEHISHWDYDRSTTPTLDALARRGLSFENVFTPAAEGAGSVMSVLTGLNPLEHGYLAGHASSLPVDTRTFMEILQEQGYFTAAFTEGAHPEQGDLYFGSGAERGVDYFDPEYPVAAGRVSERPSAITQVAHAGSKVTLDKARRWIESHRGQKYAALIRLRELSTPQWQARHGEGYAGPRPSSARPIDRYDTKLRDVDSKLGEFLTAVNASGGPSPLIIVVGSYGLDFTEPGRGAWRRGGEGIPRMGESSLRVPVIVAGPGTPRGKRSDLRSMLDLAPTLYDLLDLPLPHDMEGQSLLEEVQDARPISMMGSPLSLSIRTLEWRYIWHSGRHPFRDEILASPSHELVDVIRLHNNIAQPKNIMERERRRINEFRGRLQEYLEEHTGIPYRSE